MNKATDWKPTDEQTPAAAAEGGGADDATLVMLADCERLNRLESVVFELVQSAWSHLGTERCRQLLEIMTPTHKYAAALRAQSDSHRHRETLKSLALAAKLNIREVILGMDKSPETRAYEDHLRGACEALDKLTTAIAGCTESDDRLLTVALNNWTVRPVQGSTDYEVVDEFNVVKGRGFDPIVAVDAARSDAPRPSTREAPSLPATVRPLSDDERLFIRFTAAMPTNPPIPDMVRDWLDRYEATVVQSADDTRLADLERSFALFEYLNTACRREIPMRNITGGEHDGITYRWQIDLYVPKGDGERAPDIEDAITAHQERGK